MDNLINNSIVYYINLDGQNKRNNNILNELTQIFPINIINRFSGIKHKNGAIGCSQSHINVLFQFIKTQKKYCFIFEDDFTFLFPIDEIKNMILNAFQHDFNVLLLSYNNLGIEFNHINNNIAYIIKNARTTAGYIVNHKYAKILLNNYLQGLQYLIDTENKKQFAIDIYWNLLQNTENKFYAMMPCIGTQMAGYSNIELTYTDYIQCNTCIILVDFHLDKKKSPFYCLNYNNINFNTINIIKNKYPKIKYLFRFTEKIFLNLDWNIIFNIYKKFIYKIMKNQNSYSYFILSFLNNDIFFNEIIKITDFDMSFCCVLN